MWTFNKLVNGEHITVQFHFDDLKVSQKNQAVLDDFLYELRQEYELTETRGVVHEYLGITIDYLIAGKVVFTMFNYLKDMFVECVENLKNSYSHYS